jgi:hypothetical protein
MNDIEGTKRKIFTQQEYKYEGKILHVTDTYITLHDNKLQQDILIPHTNISTIRPSTGGTR